MPLVYIDGVRVDASFQDLTKLDIESFEIIKGAAATVLYGEDAAGGAIQIFTKNPGTSPVASRT